MVSVLAFRSLIHFEFILYIVLENVLISSFYIKLSSFPGPLIEETVFSPLYNVIFTKSGSDFITLLI